MNQLPLDYNNQTNKDKGDFHYKTLAACLDIPAALMMILAIWRHQFSYLLPISLLLSVVLYLVLFVFAVLRAEHKLIRSLFTIANGFSFMILALGIFFKSQSFPFGSELMFLGTFAYIAYHLLLPLYYHFTQSNGRLTLVFVAYALAIGLGLVVFLMKMMYWSPLPQPFLIGSTAFMGLVAIYILFLLATNWKNYNIFFFYLPRLLVLITVGFVPFLNPLDVLTRILQSQ